MTMESRASIRAHPIHPMLIVFPIGLWIFSFICDVVVLLGVNNSLFWKEMAFYTMAGGVVGALLAAIPGFIDYFSIRESTIRSIATAHMVLNLVVTTLFAVNLILRLNRPATTALSELVLSVVALAMLTVSGWLGGSLVYKHGVSVVTPYSETDRRNRAA
jgi:uncharacterized membrane protein